MSKVNYHEDVQEAMAKELEAFKAEGIEVGIPVQSFGSNRVVRKKVSHRTKSAAVSGSRLKEKSGLSESESKRTNKK